MMMDRRIVSLDVFRALTGRNDDIDDCIYTMSRPKGDSPMAKRLLLFLLAMLLVSSSTWGADPIRIGVFLSLSGSMEREGRQAWDGIRIAHKMAPTVLDRPVVLAVADTRSEPSAAAASMFRLIERDKVVAVIGDVASNNTIAGSFCAVQKGIPVVSPTATSCLVGQNKRCVFRVCFLDSDQGRVAARIARQRLEARTAVVCVDMGQHYSLGLANFFRQEFANLGGKVLTRVYFKTGDRDFTQQLNRVKKLHPDVIFAPVYLTECALIAKQAREMGLTMPIVAGDAVDRDELISDGATAVEGLHFTAHFDREMIRGGLGEFFLSQFESETGTKLSSCAAMAADAYFVLLDAISRARTCRPAGIKKALARTSHFAGVTGTITMGPDGSAVRPVAVKQVRGGALEYLTAAYPKNFPR